jgi:hypothetical protein
MIPIDPCTRPLDFPFNEARSPLRSRGIQQMVVPWGWQFGSPYKNKRFGVILSFEFLPIGRDQVQGFAVWKPKEYGTGIFDGSEHGDPAESTHAMRFSCADSVGAVDEIQFSGALDDERPAFWLSTNWRNYEQGQLRVRNYG